MSRTIDLTCSCGKLNRLIIPKALSSPFAEIEAERERQKRIRPGMDDHAPWVWIALLGEFVGKTQGEVLSAGRWIPDNGASLPANRRKYAGLQGSLERYRKRLVEVAALAVAAVEALDRGAWVGMTEPGVD